MNKSTRTQIKTLITSKIQNKLENYEAETTSSPFFEAIFGKDTIINASIMQSLYTSFGMSIYEQLAVILAKAAGYQAERQYELLGSINDKVELMINGFCKNRGSSKNDELEKIRASTGLGKQESDLESVVDVFIKTPDTEWYIDITTVKPNLKEFRSLRKKMLRWSALRFSRGDKVKTQNIKTCIGIPYNPYAPENYLRWTGAECHPDDLLVQNDLWHICAGYDVYPELINVFQEIGKEMRSEVNAFISKKR